MDAAFVGALIVRRELKKLRRWDALVRIRVLGTSVYDVIIHVISFDPNRRCWVESHEFGIITLTAMVQSGLLYQLDEADRPEGIDGLLLKAVPN